MYNKRKASFFLFFLIIAASIVGGSYYFSPALAAEESIKIGVPIPLTGRFAAFGKRMHNGYEMALADLNARGGIKGKKVELIYEDTVGEPKTAMAAVKKLITRTNVSMLIGAFSSSETFAAAQVSQTYKTPFVISIGSSAKITQSGWDYIFRIHPATTDYPAATLDFWTKEIVKPKSTVIIHEETLWGTSVAEAMVKNCKEKGIEVLLQESYENGIVDLKPLLMKVKALKPDVVFTTSYLLDGALFMRQAKEIDLNAKAFFGSGAETSPEYLEAAGDACNLQFTTDWFTKSLPFPKVKEFWDLHFKEYGEDPVYHAALCYAAVQVTEDALNRTKSMKKEDLKKALETTDVMTIMGPVKFENYDGHLHQDRPSILLSQWQNKSLYPVYPPDSAVKKYVYPVPQWKER